MKIKKIQNKTRKIVITTAVIFFLLVCGYAGAAIKMHLWPFEVKSTEISHTPTQTEIDSNTKESPKKTTEKSDTSDPKAQPVDPTKTTDQVPTSPGLTAKITDLRQDNGNVIFSGIAEGLNQPGSCVITFSNPNDKPVSRQVDSTTKNNVTVCGPIEISQLEFSYLGTWNFDFRFYTNDQQAHANATIDIR